MIIYVFQDLHFLTHLQFCDNPCELERERGDRVIERDYQV